MYEDGKKCDYTDKNSFSVYHYILAGPAPPSLLKILLLYGYKLNVLQRAGGGRRPAALLFAKSPHAKSDAEKMLLLLRHGYLVRCGAESGLSARCVRLGGVPQRSVANQRYQSHFKALLTLLAKLQEYAFCLYAEARARVAPLWRARKVNIFSAFKIATALANASIELSMEDFNEPLTRGGTAAPLSSFAARVVEAHRRATESAASAIALAPHKANFRAKVLCLNDASFPPALLYNRLRPFFISFTFFFYNVKKKIGEIHS